MCRPVEKELLAVDCFELAGVTAATAAATTRPPESPHFFFVRAPGMLLLSKQNPDELES